MAAAREAAAAKAAEDEAAAAKAKEDADLEAAKAAQDKAIPCMLTPSHSAVMRLRCVWHGVQEEQEAREAEEAAKAARQAAEDAKAAGVMAAGGVAWGRRGAERWVGWGAMCRG